MMNSCQNDIDILIQTSSSWGLALNPSKCVALRFVRATPQGGQPDNVYYISNVPIPFQVSAVDLGVTVDNKLKFHQHISNVTHKAGGVAHNILRSTLNRDASFMLPLFITHIRPLLEYASSVWNLGYIGDLRQLESVQRRWTREIDGMEGLNYYQRLKALNLFSVKGRLLRHDIIMYWKIFHGMSSITRDKVFPCPLMDRTRGHNFKIYHTRSQIEVRRRFFTMRSVNLWNSLPSDLVSCENITSFKHLLEAHLGDMLFDFVD